MKHLGSHTKLLPLPLESTVTPNKKLKIGLLGGSFDPAHLGHINVTQEIMKKLKLDYVFWLVTVQNPLKTKDISNSTLERIKYAEKIIAKYAKYPHRIIVSNIEYHLNTRFTAKILRRLKMMHNASVDFTWIMGGDNAINLTKWYHWKEILDNTDIAIYDREGSTYNVTRSKALRQKHVSILAKESAHNKQEKNNESKNSVYFVRLKKNNLSSMALRNEDT